MHWENVDDPGDLRELFAGLATENAYGVAYYRGDGKTAVLENDSLVIREWTVKDTGELCFYVYSRPDREIECRTIQRAKADPKLYRYKGIWGYVQFRSTEPPKRLVDANNRKSRSGVIARPKVH